MKKQTAKANFLQIVAQSQEAENREKGILDRLQASSRALQDVAGKQIVFSPAWITMGDVPIIAKGTINLVQGKAGAHKSRLAENIASLLLGNKRESLGFTKYTSMGYCVAYVDTERNTLEDFPAAIQRIRQGAGYLPTQDVPNFYPVSIKQEQREDRLLAVKTWISEVQSDMFTRGVGDWNLLVILDVVTDCVRSFNNDSDALTLFDYIGNLCEDHGVAFLLLLHENPGTGEKARGHVGTEALNKANTQIQIGYERKEDGNDSELIKMKFLKCRNGQKPLPVYFQFSPLEKTLVSADPNAVKELLSEKTKAGKLEPTVEALQRFFSDGRKEAAHSEIIGALCEMLGIADKTARMRISEMIAGQIPILYQGKAYKLEATRKRGSTTTYSLVDSYGITTATHTDTGEDVPF